MHGGRRPKTLNVSRPPALIPERGGSTPFRTFGLAYENRDACSGATFGNGALWFPCGDDRRAGYFVGLIWRGARPAALSSAVIWRKHSMPDSVKAVTPSSPGP